MPYPEWVSSPDSAGRPPRSKTGFGPGEWLLLALPIISGVRLRIAAGSGGDVVAAEMLVDMAGPGLALLAIAVGAGGRIALPAAAHVDSALLRRASTQRMVAIFLAAGIGLGIVFPVDLITPNGPWRHMARWALGVALPAWSAGMYALVRGRHSAIALLASLFLGAAPSAVALAIGLFYGLPDGALVMVTTVVGVGAGGGAALAAWFGVSAPGWVVLGTITALASGPGWAVGRYASDPDPSTLDVHSVQALSDDGERMLLRTGRADTQVFRGVEVDLATGETELLHPRSRAATFVGSTRVTWRRSPLHHSANWRQPRDLCRQAPGEEPTCKIGAFPGTGIPLLGAHPRLPIVLVTLYDRIIVWDLTTDETSEIRHDEARIRWPCFHGDASILYRLQSASGPFSQHSLDLATMETKLLTRGHKIQCEPGIPDRPHAQFLRGIAGLSVPARIVAPELPAGGVALTGNALIASWSRDGDTLAVLFEGPIDNLALYTKADGLLPRLTLNAPSDVQVSPDGSMLAYARYVHDAWRAHVVALPSGEELTELASDNGNLRFQTDGSLIITQDREIIRLDPRGHSRTVIFPPPRK